MDGGTFGNERLDDIEGIRSGLCDGDGVSLGGQCFASSLNLLVGGELGVLFVSRLEGGRLKLSVDGDELRSGGHLGLFDWRKVGLALSKAY